MPKDLREATVESESIQAEPLSEAELEAMKLRARRVRDRVAMNNSFSVLAQSVGRVGKSPPPPSER